MTTTISSDLTNVSVSSKEIVTVADIYAYFDGLFDQDVDADILFASGYLRGFIALVATSFGDEKQVITTDLVNEVTLKLKAAKSELSPQDGVIVNNFWLGLQNSFIHAS